MEFGREEIGTNTCSPLRWLAAAMVSIPIGFVASFPLSMIVQLPFLKGFSLIADHMPLWRMLIPYCAYLIGLWAALRLLAKTAFRDFILGEDRTLSERKAPLLLVLTLLGAVLSAWFQLTRAQRGTVSASEAASLFLPLLILSGVRAAWEEAVFRGLFLRASSGDHIRAAVPAVLLSFVSALLYAVLQAFEKGSVVTGVIWFAFGILLYFADLACGSLLPGLLLGWAQHFVSCFLIASGDSVFAASSLFVQEGRTHSLPLLLGFLFLCIPVFAYSFVRLVKRMDADFPSGGN